MPDPIARKRLKKKMLDRWENEGGSDCHRHNKCGCEQTDERR